LVPGFDLSFGIASAEQATILRTKLELPHRPAFVAIDQKGSEPVGFAGKFLAPLPVSVIRGISLISVAPSGFIISKAYFVELT
jgi:hypothetical protein